MKVITRGVPDSEKRYRVTCYSCKSVLEYAHKEILRIASDHREGESHELGQCPVCTKALYNYAPKPLDEMFKDSFYNR